MGENGANFKRKHCSPTCYYKAMREVRKGKANPAYVHGLRMSDKKKGKDYQNTKHLRACSAYKKAFFDKNGRLFCEVCRANEMQTMKFETHHIYFASKYPRHVELHNPKNLILVCIQCHNNFHAGKKYQVVFERLERTRGLKELFKS